MSKSKSFYLKKIYIYNELEHISVIAI